MVDPDWTIVLKNSCVLVGQKLSKKCSPRIKSAVWRFSGLEYFNGSRRNSLISGDDDDELPTCGISVM